MEACLLAPFDLCRAVDLALSVGIFPYVLKLLQTISVDLRPTLVFIWCKILALDLSCQVRSCMAVRGRSTCGVIADLQEDQHV
jgi:hypothetical protein